MSLHNILYLLSLNAKTFYLEFDNQLFYQQIVSSTLSSTGKQDKNRINIFQLPDDSLVNYTMPTFNGQKIFSFLDNSTYFFSQVKPQITTR